MPPLPSQVPGLQLCATCASMNQCHGLFIYLFILLNFMCMVSKCTPAILGPLEEQPVLLATESSLQAAVLLSVTGKFPAFSESLSLQHPFSFLELGRRALSSQADFLW